jgi:hypothetical protein
MIAGPALICVTLLAAACGSSQAPAPTTTVTVTHPAQPSTPAAASSTPAAPVPAGAAPCPTRSLGVKLGLAQGAAGSTYQAIVFTNISSVTCTLYGYPGVSLGTGHPVTQVGVAADENPSPPRQLVTLAPGKMANALLRIVHAANYPPARCSPVSTGWLQIYPPNQTTPVYLAYATTGCAKPVHLLTVNVVQPGSGG